MVFVSDDGTELAMTGFGINGGGRSWVVVTWVEEWVVETWVGGGDMGGWWRHGWNGWWRTWVVVETWVP